MNIKTLIEQLIEKSNPETDDKIVKSFQMKDELSSEISDKSGDSYKMNKGVRDKLMDISNAFLDFIDIDFFVLYYY